MLDDSLIHQMAAELQQSEQSREQIRHFSKRFPGMTIDDGGFKYNPPHGGPADTDATKWIENRANELITARLDGVKRVPLARALAAETTSRYDFLGSYIDDLPNVLNLFNRL